MRAHIIGYGSYVPVRCMRNTDLPEYLETSDDWIRQRTGITQRYIAADGEKTSDLAAAAGLAALKDADVTADQIDLIILATSTPDLTMPATAVKVQQLLGASRAAAFDVQAVCSGFVYGLATANSFISSGQYKTVLVIGAETFSRIIDWHDRSTCVLFGDGAGALLLQAGDDNGGILSTHLFADGSQQAMLCTNGGASSSDLVGKLMMNGKEVYRHAVVRMVEAAQTALQHNGLTINDINWFIPHQANIRIMQAVAEKLSLPMEKVIVTIDQHANTSAASIPLALAHARASGQLKSGQTLLLTAMGAGFTWGSAVVAISKRIS